MKKIEEYIEDGIKYYVEDSIKYMIDDDGEIHFICDRSLRRKLKNIDDVQFMKWENYNKQMAKIGGKPIIDYLYFLKEILGLMISVEEQCIIDEARKKDRYAEYMKGKNDFSKFLIENEFGAFYFTHYNELLALDMESGMISRFVYLTTYMDYNNQLKFHRGLPMKQSDLEDVWQLSRNETGRTKKALIEHELLIVNEDKTLSINKKYVSKGKVSKSKLKKGCVRMFENGIRGLYEGVTPKEHKKLDSLIKILPYIHYDLNIICHNPNESDRDKIEPFTMKELCEELGYTKTNATRFRKDLLTIRVNGHSCIAITLVNNKHAISVNPRVYYKGNKINELKGLIAIFDILE